MEKFKVFVKKNKIVVAGVVGLLIGILGAPVGISEEEFNAVKNDYTAINSDLEQANLTIKDLEDKLVEAKPYFDMSETEKEAMKIENAKIEEANRKEEERLAKEKAEEEERVAKEKAAEEEAKKKAELEARNVTLGNGTYLVGKDIPAGVYDLFAAKGGGNVMSSDYKVNLIMGTSGDENFYQREQQNVALKEGVTIELSGVTVKFVPDDGYSLNN